MVLRSRFKEKGVADADAEEAEDEDDMDQGDGDDEDEDDMDQSDGEYESKYLAVHTPLEYFPPAEQIWTDPGMQPLMGMGETAYGRGMIQLEGTPSLINTLLSSYTRSMILIQHSRLAYKGCIISNEKSIGQLGNFIGKGWEQAQAAPAAAATAVPVAVSDAASGLFGPPQAVPAFVPPPEMVYGGASRRHGTSRKPALKKTRRKRNKRTPKRRLRRNKNSQKTSKLRFKSRGRRRNYRRHARTLRRRRRKN